MNQRILHKEVQEFINQNLKSNLTQLILKGSPFDDVSIQEIAQQIVSKQKSEKKLPTWFQSFGIYYPPKLNLEQTSSEITANYKARLIQGSTLVDMTGGFGVDSMAFAKQFHQVFHCEKNLDLSKIAEHNFKNLGLLNIDCIEGDAIEFIKKSTSKFDCIYVDPSRRNDIKGKVFLLEDCEPNIPSNLDLLFEYTSQILIKTSPILDITSAINELNFVKEVHVIALSNEVKELLFLLEKDYQDSVKIKTVNIDKTSEQHFTFNKATTVNSKYSLPLKYVYEPNSAILKSGGFHEVSHQLKMHKLGVHSHLYTSDLLIPFPGRRFIIEHILPYDKKKIKRLLQIKKANITTRNFPKSVDQIRKELKLSDGGSQYLFFTKDMNDKFVCLICKKA